MTTDPAPPGQHTDIRLDRARARIARSCRVSPVIYTMPVIDQAARLLVDMLTTGQQHGIDPERWGHVTDLPDACLDVVSDLIGQQRPAAGVNPDAAKQVIGWLHEQLQALGVPDVHRPGSYAVTFTVAGGRRSVRCHLDGWRYDLDGPGRNTDIYAPYTRDGAHAVADAIAAIIAGTAPDPLTRRL